MKANQNNNQPVNNIVERIPELKKFIDMVAEKQREFLIRQREILKKQWEAYYAADREACDAWNNSTLRDHDWRVKCDELFRKAHNMKPKRPVLSDERIESEVEGWKRKETNLLNTRLTTEFGDVVKTTLYVGVDGNVNGVFVGTKKTAKIESIYAGGYNIQCLHTRILIHEK